MNLKNNLLVASAALALVAVVAVVSITRTRSERHQDTQTELIQNVIGSEKTAKLSYESTDPAFVNELSSFEEENDLLWTGTGFYDDRIFLTRKTSLALTSTNRIPGNASTDQLPNLGDIERLEVFVRTTTPEDLESLTIFAGSREVPDAYAFPVSSLFERWNLVPMPRTAFVPKDPAAPLPWENVLRLEFRVVSRPGKTIVLNLENLRAEKTSDYLKDWNVNAPSFLALAKHEGKVYLTARGTGATAVATWRAVPSAKDFVYRAKLIQRSRLRSGLLFRGDFRSGFGYVFWVGGIGKSSWGLMAVTPDGTKTLASGNIKNVEFRENEPVWLQIETTGERLILSLSLDGKKFTPLETIDDTTFLSAGGLGVFEEGGSETLYNDFDFTSS